MRPENGSFTGLAPDRAAFTQHVRDALTHLHELPFVQHHPLMVILPDPGVTGAGVALRDLVVETVEQLRPSGTLPPDDTAWRRYHSLYLRYVAHESARHAAATLSVSERHERREHREAVEAIAALLWSQHVMSGRAHTSVRRSASTETSPASMTNIAGVVRGVHETLLPLLVVRSVTMHVAVPQTLSDSPIERVALRQALLAIIVQGIDAGRQYIGVNASETADEVHLHVLLQGGSACCLHHGFAVARKLMEACGGRIDSSMDGSDEAIAFTLPRRQCTVLLVDDDPDFVRLFRRCLFGAPYTVIATWQAAEALECIRAGVPDIVVLDILMPSLDGWEFLQTLNREAAHTHVPVLICSVLHEESLAQALGAAGYLSKPVNQPQLLATLGHYQRRAHRATDQATSGGTA